MREASMFRKEVLAYFRANVPTGYQREDGIEAFSNLPRFWFWRLRLDLMVRDGLLRSFRGRSVWRSCDGMRYYGLSESAKEAGE